MMKWKVRTETTNIGVLELGNITLEEDYMEVIIDICDMSDSLKEEIANVIEIEKIRYSEDIVKDMENGVFTHPLKCNTVWSDKPVIIHYTYLKVHLEASKPIDYSIELGFTDAEDCFMEGDCRITVDLSEHANELKKAIIKVLVDRFF